MFLHVTVLTYTYLFTYYFTLCNLLIRTFFPPGFWMLLYCMRKEMTTLKSFVCFCCFYFYFLLTGVFILVCYIYLIELFLPVFWRVPIIMDWLYYILMTSNKFAFLISDFKWHLLGKESLMSVISRPLGVGHEPYKKLAPPAGSDLHYSGVLRRVHRQLRRSLRIALQTEVRGHSGCITVWALVYNRV